GLGLNDFIDVKDLTYTSGHMTTSTSFVNGVTTLVVSNDSTSQHVTFALAGNYTPSTWTFAQDSGTGTIFHDPPAPDADATTAPGPTSTDLPKPVTAALTTQDATADQFTFESPTQSGTPGGDPTPVASADPSATDAAAATPDTGHTSPSAPTDGA